MRIIRESETQLRSDQVRVMAQGFYHLAQVDGITESEEELIRSFLKEGGLEIDLDAIGAIPFSLDELSFGLDTIFLRKMFLKICVLIAKADDTVTQAEVAEFRRISQALGVSEPFEELLQELEGKGL